MRIVLNDVVRGKRIEVDVDPKMELSDILKSINNNKPLQAMTWTHFNYESALNAANLGHHVEGTKVYLSDDSQAEWISNNILDSEIGIQFLNVEDVKKEDIRPMLLDRVIRAGYKPDLLEDKTILLGGLGVLGNEIAWYLSCIGIGKLIAIDYGKVDWYNLGRQFLYSPSSIGRHKVDAAAESLEFTGMLQYIPVALKIPCFSDDRSEEELKKSIDKLIVLVKQSDLVIGSFDIFSARGVLQAICKEYNKPFLSCALDIQGGDVRLFPKDSPDCFGCGIDHAIKSDAGVCTVATLEMQKMVGCITGKVSNDVLQGKENDLIEYRIYSNLSIERIKRSNRGFKCKICSKEKRKNPQSSLSDFIIDWIRGEA